MPIQRPEHVPTLAICDECGAAAEMQEADEGEAVGPLGWVIIHMTRTVPNPDYLNEQDEQAAFVEGGIAQMKKQVESAGGKWTAEMQGESWEGLREQSEPESSPYYAQDLDAVLCTQHAEYAQTRLGVAEWPEVDEDEPDEEVR